LTDRTAKRDGAAAAEIISLYRLYNIIASRDGSDGGTAVVVPIGDEEMYEQKKKLITTD